MDVITHELDRFDELELYPLADVHLEDPQSDYKRLIQWRTEVLSEPNRYVLCLGDLINMATRGSPTDQYGEQLDPNTAIDRIVAFLEPMRDRLLVMVDGNHEQRAYRETGLRIMHRVSRELGLDCYAETAFLVFLTFGRRARRHDRKLTYALYCKHGAGGGRKVGAKAIRLLEMAETVDADIYLHAHTHQPMVLPKLYYRIDYRNRKLKPTERVFVNANAFLTFGGYGESKGMSPVSTRWPRLILDGKHREVRAVV